MSTAGLEKPQSGRGMQQSQGRNRPLQTSSGNASHSPNKRPPKDSTKGTFRKPSVTARGSKVRNVQKLLDNHSVMRDVLNELNPTLDENAPHATNGRKNMEFDIDMDEDFDPADFGVF